MLLAFLILHIDLLQESETYSFHRIVHPNHYSCKLLHQTSHHFSYPHHFPQILAASADTLAFFGGII